MKNTLRVLVLAAAASLIGCNKPNPATQGSESLKKDTVESTIPGETERNDSSQYTRKITDTAVVVTVNASVLPIEIPEEFTANVAQLVVEIKDYHKPDLSAKITVSEKEFNIRFNQIRTPDGKWDGPFGREIENYPIPKSGEVQLVIGKSLMASGSDKGKFVVNLQ